MIFPFDPEFPSTEHGFHFLNRAMCIYLKMCRVYKGFSNGNPMDLPFPWFSFVFLSSKTSPYLPCGGAGAVCLHVPDNVF